MSLLKYIGFKEKTIIINGNKKHLSPGQMFSGPAYLGEKFSDEFELLEVTKTSNTKEVVVKLEMKEYYSSESRLELLEENSLSLVSICILTKDNPRVIKKCIESIYTHNHYPNIEILICDTGTTNQEVLTYYEEILKDDRVFIYRNHVYNYSKNNNFLAGKAGGGVLLFMNNDVFLTYDAISEMVKYINCSNMGCLGHRMVWEREPMRIQHDGQLLYDNSGKWIGPGHKNYKKMIHEVEDTNVRVEGVTAAFLMVRKSIFDKVKGFSERYSDVYQDVDLNLKVSSLGYINFCIRKQHIIHVDHSSRDESDPIVKNRMVSDFQIFKRDWISKGNYPVKPNPRYSILICATNQSQLKDLWMSIKTRDEYEFIFANNKRNYMSSSVALNTLTEVSVGEIIFYTHQDVTFDVDEPFSMIDRTIGKLGNVFGVIGPAGVLYNGGHTVKGIDFSSNKYSFDVMRVQTLDEFCMITKRSNGLKFGEYLDHFHFYGADLCCEAMDKGLRNYVINVGITHHSGGSGNLKNEDGYAKYMESARNFYKKWGVKHPKISTTTARFQDGHIYYFLAHQLGLRPYEENIIVTNLESV